MRRRISVLATALIAVVILAGAVPATAAVTRVFRYTLPQPGPDFRAGGDSQLGPGAARKLVVRPIESAFAASGEGVSTVTSAQVLTNVPGCGVPVVTSAGDSVVVTWPSDCADPGEYVILRITASGGELTCGTGHWQHASGVVLGPAVCLPLPLPGTTPVAAVVLAAFLALVGGAMLRLGDTRRVS